MHDVGDPLTASATHNRGENLTALATHNGEEEEMEKDPLTAPASTTHNVRITSALASPDGLMDS
jgi:hypothetical protein